MITRDFTGKVAQNKPQPKRRYHDKARESSGALQ